MGVRGRALATVISQVISAMTILSTATQFTSVLENMSDMSY